MAIAIVAAYLNLKHEQRRLLNDDEPNCSANTLPTSILHINLDGGKCRGSPKRKHNASKGSEIAAEGWRGINGVKSRVGRRLITSHVIGTHVQRDLDHGEKTCCKGGQQCSYCNWPVR